MKRGVLIVLALAGCRRAGETSSVPLIPLDHAAEEEGSGPLPDPPAAPAMPAEFDPLDKPAPASAPAGDPIRVTFVPPKVGAKRGRTLAIYDIRDDAFEIDGKHDTRHQVSQHVYRTQEVVQQVDGGSVAAIRVTAVEARELIELDGTPHPMTLLQGTYDIDIAGGELSHGRIGATSTSGRSVGSREEEELGLLFGMDAGNENGLVKLLRVHPLRRGEAVVLTDAEKQTLVGGEPVPAPVTLALVDVNSGRATYQLDLDLVTKDGDHSSERKVRERFTIAIATGQLLGTEELSAETERSPTSNSDVKSQATMTFTPW